MKIWSISDTHGLHGKLIVPKVDMVIFAGDAGTYKNPYQNKQSILNFIEWFESLSIRYKIWIAGNHCTSIETGLVNPKELCSTSIYLEHEPAEIGGLKIYGSPWTPHFYDWAFNASNSELLSLWNDIPENLNLLITHGPCKGILDKVSFDGYRAGDAALRDRIITTKPKYHICGHIHENFGTYQGKNTTFINCAVVNDEYKLINNGHIFEL
jgi:Icc-related predicted phosphoesterase